MTIPRPSSIVCRPEEFNCSECMLVEFVRHCDGGYWNCFLIELVLNEEAVVSGEAGRHRRMGPDLPAPTFITNFLRVTYGTRIECWMEQLQLRAHNLKQLVVASSEDKQVLALM